MTQKFLCIGADKENATDGVIVKGIYNILDKLYPNNQKQYLFIDDHKQMSEDQFFTDLDFSGIIVCGTPWLWENFQDSQKYNNVFKIFKSHPKSKKVFMGAGSCMHLESVGSNILKTKKEIDGIKKLYDGTVVIARDKLAFDLFSNAGIKATFLPCPAYFAYGVDYVPIDKKEHNVLIWCNPQKTISSSGWHDSKKLKMYHDVCKHYVEKSNARVYCALSHEIDSAVKIGLKTPIVLQGYQHTLDIMKNANFVLSGRVHCAVPAFVQGCKLAIMPIDTRCFVLKDFGCKCVNNLGDLVFMRSNKINLQYYFELYKDILLKTI